MMRIGGEERSWDSMPGRSATLVLACLGLWGAVPVGASGQERDARTEEEAAPDWSSLPAEFRADRVFLHGRLADGGVLTFFTDTGGGANMLFEDASEDLGLAVREVGEGEQRVRLTAWPRWRDEEGIPAPGVVAPPLRDDLMVVPRSGDLVSILDPDVQAFLGRTWFGDRAWLFDYPAGTLHTASYGGLEGAAGSEGVVPLGFQVNGEGVRTTHFPRIAIEVDGEVLEVLFDTGASSRLTEAALAAVGDGGPPRRASSFISQAVFDRWRAAHPDWSVVEGGTSFDADLIEVPVVAVAGYEVGPVWFESRRVGVFEEYMSGFMDAPIQGAAGGNIFRFFRITVDYPAALARFEPATGLAR